MTSNRTAPRSEANGHSALEDALESASDSIRDARGDATRSAKLAARRVQFGVSAGAYYTAYGVSYGLVFSGVFLKELLPAGSAFRRGLEDGATAAVAAAVHTAAALDEPEDYEEEDVLPESAETD